LEAPDFYTPGAIFMATGDQGYFGLVRLEDGRLDIAAALERSAVQHACGPARVVGGLLASVRWPAIGQLEHLAWRGTPGLTRQATRVSGERLFVVGDAAEYVEPFTGEGIAWALETAAALAPWADQAVQEWTPRLATRWQSRYRRLVRQRRTCRAAAFVLRSPVATRGLVGLLHRMPFLGSPVIRLLNRPVLDQAEPA
jgi:2-polyprenyl-6-methoxyphenol hydroxylase-like FAD-dependent oxidoreductase